VPTLLLVDYDPRVLAERYAVLQAQVDARADRDRWPVRATGVRGDALDLIASSSPAGVVALVDLREHEVDLEYAGRELINTIRRHPHLCTRCWPLALSAYATHRVADDVRRIGGYATIELVYALRAGIVPAVERVLAENPHPGGEERPASFLHLTDSKVSAADDEARRRAQHERMLDIPYQRDDGRIVDLAVRGHDRATIAEILRPRDDGKGRFAVRRRVSEIMGAARRGLHRAANPRHALAEMRVIGMPPDAPTISHRHDRPPWSRTREAWRSDTLRRLAYLPPREEAAVEAYVQADSHEPSPPAKAGTKSTAKESAREERLTRAVADRLGITVEEADVLLYWGLRRLHSAWVDEVRRARRLDARG
jgi:hypothetical protein